MNINDGRLAEAYCNNYASRTRVRRGGVRGGPLGKKQRIEGSFLRVDNESMLQGDKVRGIDNKSSGTTPLWPLDNFLRFLFT